MKSKFASFIMSFIIMLIISVFAIFGVILWNELIDVETSIQPESVQTVISENKNTIDNNITAPEIVDNPFEEIKDGGTQQITEVDYSNVRINKYFYNQLEQPSKTIYQAFEANKENMKTGTYQVEFGNAFASILNTNGGQDKLGDYYQSAIEAYTYDNPDVFYLSANKMYLNVETITKGTNVSYNVYINNGKEANYLIDEFSSKQEIDKAINQIEEVKKQLLQNKKSNTYDNIKMVHDYLVKNIEYDVTISKENIYNIYGALILKESVCEGYARSFKYMMDALGIPSTLVIGKGTNSEGETETHAWNYVQIGEKWYAIDCTWDDPVSDIGWVSKNSRYKYFLKGSNDMIEDHTPSGQFTEGGKVFSYPPLSKDNYE